MKTILELSPEQLRRAAQIKDQITSLEKQMQALLGQGSTATRNRSARPSGRPGAMSESARAKISQAMKARWAERKGGNKAEPARTATTTAKKRKPMSAAQRAKIAETLRARWAKVKAAKK